MQWLLRPLKFSRLAPLTEYQSIDEILSPQVYDETLQIISTSFGGLPDSSIIDINRIFNSIRSVSCVELQGENVALLMERGKCGHIDLI